MFETKPVFSSFPKISYKIYTFGFQEKKKRRATILNTENLDKIRNKFKINLYESVEIVFISCNYVIKIKVTRLSEI